MPGPLLKLTEFDTNAAIYVDPAAITLIRRMTPVIDDMPLPPRTRITAGRDIVLVNETPDQIHDLIARSASPAL
jgi:hypothetical protein